MKIDIKDNSGGSNIKRCDFPADSKFLGSEENREDMKIFIKEDILDRVDKFLSSDMQNELGGVLIGQECISKDKEKFILIENYIEAEHSNSSLSRLTFTHETWDHINQVLESDYPDMKILGWFHSHPGHTVFLSNYDVFIQENFFDMNYMVAYVYDPTINDRGFFLWRDEKIVKSDGFHVYEIKKDGDTIDDTIIVNTLNDSIDHELESIKSSNGSQSSFSKIIGSEFKNVIVIVLLLLTLLVLLLMIYNYYDLKQKALLKEQYVKDLAELRSENKKLSELLNSYIIDNQIKKSLASGEKNVSLQKNESVTDKKDQTKNPPVTSNNNTGTSMEPNLNSNSSGNPNTANETKPETPKDEVKNILTVYTVKSGDTLEKISNQFYKNRTGIDLLMKHNNIKNKADIKIGQKLEIPEQ